MEMHHHDCQQLVCSPLGTCEVSTAHQVVTGGKCRKERGGRDGVGGILPAEVCHCLTVEEKGGGGKRPMGRKGGAWVRGDSVQKKQASGES